MKNKKITIAALIVAVLSLSIGFAAFSNSLNIKSSANVNPSDKDFKIVFSKERDTFVSGNEIINATGDINENTKKGSINDIGDTLYNLETEFTTPGESVEYSLYIKNIGAYNAVLNKLEIEEAELTSDITVDNYYIVDNGSVKCYAKKDPQNKANEELLKEACNNIKLKVKLQQESEYITSTKEFDSYVINKGESESVTVTLEYTGDTLADTGFNVVFGSVKMNYATTKASSSGTTVGCEDSEIENEYANGSALPFAATGGKCILEKDNDSSNTITKGDYVKCGTEGFYVIKDPSNGKISMLTEWNLNVVDPINTVYMAKGDIKEQSISRSCPSYTEKYGYQNKYVIGGFIAEITAETKPYIAVELTSDEESIGLGYGNLAFYNIATSDDELFKIGSYGYWTDGTSDGLDPNFSGTYPMYVYGKVNSNGKTSTLTPLVNTYVSLLNNSIGGAEATGRLISYEELIDLGCMKDTHSCENAPVWASQTSYWTGSAGDSSLPWYILNGEFNNDSYFNEILFGLRPVIELNESAIEE